MNVRCVNRRPRLTRFNGFTLLELLIVLFIIGLTLSFAIINLTTSEQQEVEDEASRLMALIQVARENAILDAEDLAVAFTDKGYRFEKYDGAEWQPLDDATLRFRPFAEDLKVEYKLQGKQALLVVRHTASTGEDQDAGTDEKNAVDDETTDLSELKGKSVSDITERKTSSKKRDEARRKTNEDDDEKKKKDKKKEPEPLRIFLLSTGEVTPFEVFFRKFDHESGYRVSGNAVGEIEMAAVIKEIKG